ncbi:CD48 antigen-like, partial [Tachysurus fulvidraco]|uniref:CD48 antigen-like n=1 Tax=Tachysurus fulvidraco TaxID=1234273 RepID=UPI001FEE08D0
SSSGAKTLAVNTPSLRLEIKSTDKDTDRSFSCEASNPVSKETTTIDVTHVCCLDKEIFSSIGDSSVQEVIGAVGDSVTFPLHVPVSGNIIYKSDIVGRVLNSQSEINDERFVNRLRWHNQRGFFTLSDLRPDDSGLYTVQSTKDIKGKQEYRLDVYERVSAPQVTTTFSSAEFCSLLCSVRNVRGLKLVWSEDRGLLNQTISNSTSNTILSLHLEIKKTDKHRQRNFSCEASNPVSNETTTIDVTKFCSLDKGTDTRANQIVIPVVVSVILLLLVIGMFVYLKKKKQNEASRHTEDSSATEGLNEEIQYSVINHIKPTQTNIRERADEEVCQLTTIYDRIRPERTSESNTVNQS